jgi:hypothetical protein
MKKTRKTNIVTKIVKGRVYHYYRMVTSSEGRRQEKHIRIKADPGTEAFDREFWAIRSGKRTPSSRTTFTALIDNYMRSRRYTDLADGTKKKYRSILDDLRIKSGDVDVTLVRRSEVEAIHEKYAATPRMADHRIQVLRILFEHAKRLEWMTHNPASGVELFGRKREFEPWPDWMIDKLPTAPFIVRTTAELILGTGQRPNAAIEMRFDQFRGEEMTLLDEKMDKAFEVYCPKPLQDYIATLPRKGRHILARNLTEPIGYNTVASAFQTWRTSLGPAAKPYVLHGLRKLAIVRLAEAGWTDAQIHAMTNQSPTMVAYYRQLANRKRLTRRAHERNGNGT